MPYELALYIPLTWASQVALVLKNPSANAGDARVTVLIPGLESSLEKQMASHSSIIAWGIQGQRNLVGYNSPWGSKESDTTEVTEHVCMHTSNI